jgi:hypothetical protein
VGRHRVTGHSRHPGPAAGDTVAHHRPRVDDRVEPLRADVPERDGCVLSMRSFGARRKPELTTARWSSTDDRRPADGVPGCPGHAGGSSPVPHQRHRPCQPQPHPHQGRGAMTTAGGGAT